VASTKDQFEDFKKKFIAESDRVRTQLVNAYKEGTLQLKKAQEDGYMKDKIIDTAEKECVNLDALVKNIEQNNRDLLNANKNLQGAFDDLRANAKQEIHKIKDQIQDTVDQSNQLNNLLQDKLHENKSLESKNDALIKSINEKDNKYDELGNALESVMSQINIKSTNLNNYIADTNKLKSENMLKDKQNKQLDLNLKNQEIKNNKYSNQIDQLKGALNQSKINKDKINLDIDLLYKNLQNVYSTSSIVKHDIESHTLKCNELESSNNALLTINRLVKLADVDVDADLEALLKRISELESRTSIKIAES